MTLIDAFMTPCTLMVRERSADGEGGGSTEWREGWTFDAAITAESSSSGRVAERLAERGTCTVTVGKDVELAFHSVIRRDSDGATFRVVGANAPTPGMASFRFNQYRAEEWGLA